MRLLALSALLWLAALPACQRSAAAPDVVVVAAAADLKHALDELLVEFQAVHPETAVKASYGSSGNFHMQIANGAPFDLFLSADMDFPRKLAAAGLADASSLFPYASGLLVLWVPDGSPLDLEKNGLRALLDPRVRKVAVANPEHAPYGQAAVAALRHEGIYEEVAGKLVLGENVAQAAQFVETGNAEIGVIALSLALAPVMQEKGRHWQVPPDHFPPLLQGGVIPARAKNPDGAALLREWIISRRGRELLSRYGFILPAEP